MIKETTQSFLAKIFKKFPENLDKFDYSEVEYTLAVNKIKLRCKLCDHKFEQEANSHTRGVGCPCCARNQKLTTESFINKATEVHGNLYDYSLVKYTSAKDKVKIICELHGTFEQNSNNHLKGSGCPKCFGKFTSNYKDFSEKARTKHNDLYEYPLFEYKSAHTKAPIICKVHGLFHQSPANHLQGQGCPKCADSYPLDTTTFINRASEKHNGFYDYSKSYYISAKQVLTITCPIHGDFDQDASGHLAGNGCPSCRKDTSKGGVSIRSLLKRTSKYRQIPSNLYFLEILDGKGTVKIGKGKSPITRSYNIKAESGFDCNVIYQIPASSSDVLFVEQYLQDLLKERRSDIKGFAGYTECFFLSNEETTDAIEFAEFLLKDTSSIESYYRDLYKIEEKSN